MFQRAVVLACLLVTVPGSLQSQRGLREVGSDEVGSVNPKGSAGVNFQLAFPQGEFADFVGTGWGLAGHVAVHFGHRRMFGFRFTASFVQYGSTTETLPLSPTLPGILVDLTTSNNIYSFGLGPEVVLAQGTWRPYLHAGVGGSDFATESHVAGTDNFGSFASTTDFNDWVFGWQAGGGLQFRVKSGPHPIWLDLGARYQSHGETRYLREGSLTPATNGGVIVTPIQSRTELLVTHFGAVFGF